MRLRVLQTMAVTGLSILVLPACSGAQDRADAEAAMARMGLTQDSENFSYDTADWSNGRYILSGVVIRNLDVDNEDVEIDASDEMHVERMIFDAPRIDSDDNVVFDGVALEGVSLDEPDGSGHLRMARLAVDGPNAALAADLVRIFSGDEDFDPDWSRYRFDSLGFEGLDAEGEDAEGPFDVAVEQFVMQDYGDVELGRVALLGVSVDAMTETGPARFRLGEFSLTGFQSSAYTELMEAIADGADEESVMSAYYRSAFTPQLDLFDAFALRGLEGEAEGIAFTLDNLVGHIEKTGSRYTWSMELDSARLVPDAAQPAGAQVATALGMLGYEQVELSMASHSIYDEQSGRVQTVGDNYIELRDGLRLEMTQDLGGYDEYYAALPVAAEQFEDVGKGEEASAQQADAMLQMMAPIVLHNVSMRLVDLSMLDRALEAGAVAQGITTEELRMQAAAMIGVGLLSAPPEIPRPMLTQLSEALTGFINNGGSLTIAATPPEPISIGAIASQVEAGTFDYNALGLTFSAEAPE